MNAILKTVKLSPDILSVEQYMGWTRSRHFLPHLILYDFGEDMNISIKGYDKIWQFLDTICYKEPLGRKNFNNVLKHRVQDTEWTSKEIISGIITECDLDAVTFQGLLDQPTQRDKITLEVDFTYSHYDEDIHPPLIEIANVFGSYGAETVLFDNFELITRQKNNEYQRLIHTFPSIVAVLKINGKQSSTVVLRCVQFPNGNLGFFSNSFVDDKKYACNMPLQINKMDDKGVYSWIESAIKRHNLLIMTIDLEAKMIPQWKQKNTSGSTVAHFKKNAAALEAGVNDFINNR
tara:strand:+ start:467 stop:1339 length:873 start_codon:yes stop_codon:yes gene_type:complete